MLIAFKIPVEGQETLIHKTIQWWTGQPFTHVEIMLNTPTGPISVGSRTSSDGVAIWSLPKVLAEGNWLFFKVPVRKPFTEADVLAWLKQQVGKPFNYTGMLWGNVLAQPVATPIQGEHWYCSELAVVVLRLFGAVALPRMPAPNLVSPTMLYRQMRVAGLAPINKPDFINE